MKLITTAAMLVAGCLCLASAQGAIVVNVGNINVLPAANQAFDILVSGTVADQISGLNFRAQVEDGFGSVDLPAATMNGPNITAIDLVGTGTIFNPNNTGQDAFYTSPQLWERDVTTTDSPVSPFLPTSIQANGILAHIVVDASGFTVGQQFAFRITSTALGDTEFLNGVGATLPASISGGTITIVPEPASGLLAISAIGIAAVTLARRKRRRRTTQSL